MKNIALLLLASLAAPAHAQQAVRVDVFASHDADDSDAVTTALTYDYRFDNVERYRGVTIEQTRFSPLGQAATRDQRIYYRFADTGDAWKWNGSLGTDGETWLGDASIHNEDPLRQEYFVSRDLVESPLGLAQNIYYTYAGAAYDIPLNERHALTGLLGAQDFTGDNFRTHVRGRYIYTFNADWGLSPQLRLRYFRNSEPREFDYYSPVWYAEAVPSVQLRRFYGGWQYQLSVGYGRQRDAESDWRSARLLEARVTSPLRGRKWHLNGNLVHNNTPVTTGYTYSYTQVGIELTRVFGTD